LRRWSACVKRDTNIFPKSSGVYNLDQQILKDVFDKVFGTSNPDNPLFINIVESVMKRKMSFKEAPEIIISVRLRTELRMKFVLVLLWKKTQMIMIISSEGREKIFRVNKEDKNLIYLIKKICKCCVFEHCVINF